MPIGILDSGVGGLTVWKEIMALLPQQSTVYVGDSKNCPYGTKSEEEIWNLTQKLVEFLLTQQVTLVVLACNTISVTTLEKLRVMYPAIPFIGTVPAVKVAAIHSKNKRIGILSTLRTADSPYQKRLIEQFAAECVVVNRGTDTLVPFVERGELKGERVDTVLRETLQPFLDARVDVLVLGCTHYPFFKQQMQTVLGNEVHIVDSGEAIARQVKRVLEDQEVKDTKGEHRFFTSGDPKEMFPLLHTLHDSATMEQLHALL